MADESVEYGTRGSAMADGQLLQNCLKNHI